MGTLKTTAAAALLGATVLVTAAPADAHWRRYRPVHVHRHHHVPPALIGLGIAGAVLGTIAVVDAIVRPPVLVAPPPPPPPPYYYERDDRYWRDHRRGYDDDWDDDRYEDD